MVLPRAPPQGSSSGLSINHTKWYYFAYFIFATNHSLSYVVLTKLQEKPKKGHGMITAISDETHRRKSLFKDVEGKIYGS